MPTEEMTIATSTKTAASTRKQTVDKLQSYMGLASTTLGVMGVLGTVLVWATATFYTGTLEIKPSKPVEVVTVKVYDSRGQQSTYYGRQIVLMPGKYHLEVSVPGEMPKHFDTNIVFSKTTALALPVTQGSSIAGQPQQDAGKKHWWQFWRKKDEQSQ